MRWLGHCRYKTDLPPEDYQLLEDRLNLFVERYREELRRRNFPLGQFAFGRPANTYIVLDREVIHIVEEAAAAQGLPILEVYDRRQRGSLPQAEVRNGLALEKGIRNPRYIPLPASILELEGKRLEETVSDLVTRAIDAQWSRLLSEHKPLFIAPDDVRAFLALADEDLLTKTLLVPLLRHLGFEAAQAKGHRDRSLEFGQDIRNLKYHLPTGHWLYFAAQVKTGPLKYGVQKPSQSIEKALIQLGMASDKEMFDSETNLWVKPDHVLLIASGRINEGARIYLYEHLAQEKRRRILFLDSEDIVRICEKEGLPPEVQKRIQQEVRDREC